MIIYICHPLSKPSIEENIEIVRKIVREIIEDEIIGDELFTTLDESQRFLPLAPHLYFPQFMNDHDKEERALALSYDMQLIDACDVLWIYGDIISQGMKREIEYASKKGKRIECKEVPR